MVDPLSLSAVGAVALSEGIKFLYGQAGELLRRWRDVEDGAAEQAPDATLNAPTNVVEGAPERAAPDLARVGGLEPELRALRRALSDYADGTERVDADDAGLLASVDALRRLLEVVYGQHITLKGETRTPSGPLLEANVDVQQVRGHAAAVVARHIRGGRIVAKAKSDSVEAGARFSAVETDTIG